jgi:hypothetical protein
MQKRVVSSGSDPGGPEIAQRARDIVTSHPIIIGAIYNVHITPNESMSVPKLAINAAIPATRKPAARPPKIITKQRVIFN